MIGTRIAAIALVASSLAWMACAKPATVGKMRYKNQTPVWLVNDQRDVAKKPNEYGFLEIADNFKALVITPFKEAMKFPTPRRAGDINSLGEVPNSTWFTNRMGTLDLSPKDIARGPNQSDGPDLSEPLKIVKGKEGGASVGFIVEDARGDRYIVKFDHPMEPVVETATDVIVQRLLWACGYNVPENSVVYLRRDQLVVTEKSKIRDALGKKVPLTDDKVDRMLAMIHQRDDGQYRAMTSKYLSGIPVGGIKPKGVRTDDINDTVAHQHRRVLRGLYVFYSWLQYTDVKSANMLDMWVEDPDRPGQHYVKHYLVDFGKSLGAFWTLEGEESDGHAYSFDPVFDVVSLVTFGLWERPWEGTRDPGLLGVSIIDAEHFHPGKWKSHFPYLPFSRRDKFDSYWATKILMSFGPQHIRAAVAQGKFEDPDAVDYLTAVLVGRQRKIGAYWFRKVNPIDNFALGSRENGVRLCFDDLLLHHNLALPREKASHYAATSHGFDGKALGWRAEAKPGNGGSYTACVDGLQLAGDKDGYTIVRLDTWRGKKKLAPVEVHVARDPTSKTPRIIGIHRR